jgi:hypothetical protein
MDLHIVEFSDGRRIQLLTQPGRRIQVLPPPLGQNYIGFQAPFIRPSF